MRYEDCVFIRDGEVAYFDLRSWLRKNILVIIVCDCGVHSRVFSRRCTKSTAPNSLIQLKATCEFCGTETTAAIFVYVPFEIPCEGVLELEYETWKNLEVPVVITCDHSGCDGKSVTIQVPCIGLGRVRATSMCSVCQHIARAYINLN